MTASASTSTGISPGTLRGKLNVGVVGIGRMGRVHALNILHRVPRARLLCVCSPAEADLAWAAQQKLEEQGVRVAPTFEELIDVPGLDAVIIASATAFHAEQTTAALARNIHVLCEKPVCRTIEDVFRQLAALVEKVEANPASKLMVGFCRRFDQDYKDAHRSIRQDAIGRPIIFRSSGCEKTDTSPFFKQYLKDSGGIFIDSVIHDIDLSLHFFGNDSRPKSVSAVGLAAVHGELEEVGDADNAVGVCEYWDGKIAYFYHSRTTSHGYDNPTEIIGTAGKLSINLIPRRNALELSDSHGFVKTPAAPGWYDRYAEAFVTEAGDWVDALLDGKPMPVPLAACLTSLRIATALQESLRTGRKIFFTKDGIPAAK